MSDASEQLDASVDGLQLFTVPLPRSGGSMAISQGPDRALAVNENLTVAQSRVSVSTLLLGAPRERLATFANGVGVTTDAMPASGASMWIEGPDGIIFVLNEDMTLKFADAHTAEQMAAVGRPKVVAQRAS